MAASRKRRILLGILGVVVVLGAGLGYLVWDGLFRREAPRFDDIREFMKYGSVGQEVTAGIPFKVWQVLPEVCADKLQAGADPAKGYAAFGFVYEDGKDIPIGITKSRIGFDRISLSCAACHNSHYRARPEDAPTYFLSGTDTSFYGQRYFNFLFACANDARFAPATLLPAMEKHGLGTFESLLFRFLIIPKMKDELLKVEKRLSWWYDLPEAGPGRWIAFNDLKYHFAKQPRDGSIGNPDIPTMFNLQLRENIKTYHWDGFTDSLDKAMQNAAVGAGADEPAIPRDDLNRLRDWWLTQPAPPYPFPVDQTLAAQGKQVWEAAGCAGCHAIGRPTAGRVIPIEEIGTDRHRYDLITPGTVEGYNREAKAMYGWPQAWFIRKTEGYVAVLLDAVWLRAPYLHNGSVPTLADLLKPPAERPAVFYRGYDLYDPVHVGYVSTGPEAEKQFRYDTALPGNGNQGHVYGVDLPAEEKTALIEYLKTL